MLWASSGVIWRVILGTTWPARRRNATTRRADQTRGSGRGQSASPSRFFWQFQRPADDVVLKVGVGDIHLAVTDPAAHRDPSRVDRLWIAGYQRVPPIQVLTLGEQHVGAGWRQPGNGLQGLRCKAHAVIHEFLAVPIIAAAAGLAVKQPAADIGVIGSVGFLFFELIEAAFAAAVTQALPLGIRH